MKKGDILYIVLPCYNEEEVLFETSKRLKLKMRQHIESGDISEKSRIVFVDDGSKDKTWDIIQVLHQDDHLFSGVKLSRNRGHQNALLAGLMTVKDSCDVTISMDADLQDDINAIDDFLEKYFEGNEIVYGVRKDRSSDTTVKRGTAELFYKIMNKMGVKTIFNHADCRLMSRRALDALADYKEVNLFLRGMVPLIGFKSDIIEYSRAERFAGVSKYPFKKMLQLAIDGITSFSITPIRLITGAGIAFSALSILAFLTFIILVICGVAISGTAWILASIWLAAGLLMGCIGIVGEYVGKSYMEVKARPRYIVETFLNT